MKNIKEYVYAGIGLIVGFLLATFMASQDFLTY